jgi:hypothetical protein
MNGRVIVLGLDPVDLVHVEHQLTSRRGDDKSPGREERRDAVREVVAFDASVTTSIMRGEQVADPPGQLERLGETHTLARTIERSGKPRLIHRLHEVVQRMRLERPDGELVVRRYEDDVRHARRPAGTHHLEAIELRHLDVKEHEVRGKRIERGECLSAIPALAHNLHVVVRREELADASPG